MSSIADYVNLSDCKIVVDSNSIGTDYYTTNERWSMQLEFMMRREGLRPTIVNYSVGGQTTEQMVSDASTQIDAEFVSDRPCILIAHEITNDLLVNGTLTPAQAYQRFRDYCLQRRSRGFYVLAIDTFPRSSGTTQYQLNLVAANDLVRANWRDFADQFIDIRSALPQFLPGSEWLPDGIHPSGSGQIAFAAVIYSALRTIPIRKKRLEPMPETYKFNSPGTFGPITVPAWATKIHIELTSGGGGGGGGGSGTGARGGGGGGSGSGRVTDTFTLADFGIIPGTTQISGTVGAGGNGGAGGVAGGGGNGTAGGPSFIRIGASGTNYLAYCSAFGNLGGGGSTTAGTSGGTFNTVLRTATPGAASSTTAAPSAATSSVEAASGGGAGGGISAGGVAFTGSAGGRGYTAANNQRTLTNTGGAATGANGGAAAAINDFVPGDGGGGGGASLAGTGGAGAAGKNGGGGGGGGASNTGNGGPGGKGGDGVVVFTFY